jgi:hypothetical protein
MFQLYQLCLERAIQRRVIVDYVTVYYQYHARHVEHIPNYCREIIQLFLHGHFRAVFEHWQKNFVREISFPVRVPVEMRTGLSYAAFFGFPIVVEFLLNSSSHTSPEVQGFALFAEGMGGSQDVIKRMLARNIRFNVFEGQSQT